MILKDSKLIRVLRSLCLMCILQGMVVDSQTIYRIGSDCGVTSTITEKSNTQIEFDGRYDAQHILSGDSRYQHCDRIIFQTKNYEEPDAKYRICISPIYFNDRACTVSLDFKKSLFSSSLKSYDCHTSTKFKLCAPDEEKLYVFLTLDEQKSQTLTTFLFRVWAERTDEPTNVLAIVLGVLGGVAFLVVVAVIIILYRRRSMRKRGMAI
ncbi:uncharacterized protein LOC111107297 [Crassostrea virginica]